MTAIEFKARHAKTIAGLWGGVSARYDVSEDSFAERLHASASRTGELDSGDRGSSFLQSVRADELCLVLACECGNEEAWREFDRTYRSGMHAAARSLTKDEAEAEDLAQSLIGDLYGVRLEGDHRMSKFAHYAGRGSLGGWLRAVVYQTFIDRKRQTAKLEQVAEDTDFERMASAADNPLAVTPSRPDEIEDTRLRQATEEALAQGFAALEERDRLLLNYYYFEDLTLKQIGALMHVHEATISRWLQRAQKQARQKTEQILQRSYGLKRAEIAECLQLAARSEIDVRRLLQERERASAAERGI
jgi:RNA polymerase sigma-70 factor (ECF subfamily)